MRSPEYAPVGGRTTKSRLLSLSFGLLSARSSPEVLSWSQTWIPIPTSCRSAGIDPGDRPEWVDAVVVLDPGATTARRHRWGWATSPR